MKKSMRTVVVQILDVRYANRDRQGQTDQAIGKQKAGMRIRDRDRREVGKGARGAIRFTSLERTLAHEEKEGVNG